MTNSVEPESWPADLAVVIPVYNHGKTVAEVATWFCDIGAQVWVVDDGSTDGSGDAAAATAARLVRLPENQGKGRALRAGMRAVQEAGFARVITVDADGQHTLEGALALVHSGAGAKSLVIGRRDMSGAPKPNRFGRSFSNFWVWACCGLNPGDSQSGLRIYPVDETLALTVVGDRYHYEIEIIVRLIWAGLEVAQVDVPCIYPEDRISHFNVFYDNARTTRAFARLLVRRFIPWPHQKVI